MASNKKMCDKTVQRHNSRTIRPSLAMLLFGENSCGKYHRHKRNKFKPQTDKSDSDASDTIPSSLSVVTKPSAQPLTSNRYRSFITYSYHSLCCVVVCILLALLTIQTDCANGLLMDSSAINGDGDVNFGVSGSGSASSGNTGGLYLDKIGNLEKSIAAVFNKVAYGSTTTKRSIPDNVFVPSLTTVPTPPLTTYRYRDREKESQDDKNHHQQQINLYHRNYEFDLERDHALPTSAPNADILKTIQQQHEQASHPQVTPTNSDSRKKALNTPADKNKHKLDSNGNERSENGNSSDAVPNSGVFHFPSISRILSGSNGRKEVVPEVLLRSVTARPNYQVPSGSVEQTSVAGTNNKDNGNLNQNRQDDDENDGLSVEDDGEDDAEEDDFDMFEQDISPEEPKPQPNQQTNKQSVTKSTQSPYHDNDSVYSTQIIQNLANNYIHGYQNLSYAIHITIATALLFVLLAILQVYGAISIPTTRKLISSATEIDWLQCGYQFSLRLIEIAIISLLSWVTGLKTGASKVMQREKGMETHNVSGFALFPCTSSSSQEHFETDYPAICNANTNLHTYTMRTGKPIYDDNFALNSLGMDNPVPQQAAGREAVSDFQVPNSNDFTRTYETSSARSSTHASERQATDGEFLNDSGAMPDHYENPDFELRPSTRGGHHQLVMDNCYAEPVGNEHSGNERYDDRDNGQQNFDFQNFEKPTFERPTAMVPINSGTEFRASKNLKAMKNSNANNLNHLDRQHYDNPERRSSNSNHSFATGGRTLNNLNYNGAGHGSNSFDRRGIRKSGTLNNIGAVHGRGNGANNGGTSSSSNSSGRASGVQTLSSRGQDHHHLQRNITGRTSQQQQRKDRHRSSIERSSTSHLSSGYSMMGEDSYGGGRQLDSASNASSDGGSCSGGSAVGMRPCYQPERQHFKQMHRQHDINGGSSDAQNSGDSATSGSMLVAEHGFVRFRALDDMGILKHSPEFIKKIEMKTIEPFSNMDYCLYIKLKVLYLYIVKH
ncbi:hypothetical protein Bhyg_05955 [Pseudolycoriella hygida]|uniref:Uncharacterized protein n=1 Tax=Pseudolycoriella hygida TaxID=35572 RepID=A0A9Q0S0H9_9DIPT|nr:hypothetical protein Bhyg_05955 [Pseudolycoriella hygida]